MPVSNRQRLLRSLLISAVVVFAGYQVWHSWTGMRAPAAAARESPVAVEYLDSIAVMPLDNLTGDPDYDHIGMGITEEIITHLARIPPLKVISRHSVQAVSSRDLTFPQLGKILNVRHIIEGSIRLDGDRLLVTLEHVDVTTDSHMWVENYRGSLDDTVEIQEEVARLATKRVVEMIPGLTMPQFNSHVDLGPGQETYLEGQRWLGLRTAEGIDKAIADFRESIERDPAYAPAYADLSSAYALSIFYRYNVGTSGYLMAARSLAMAERALALDPDLAAGFAARGYLGALIGQPAEAVAEDFERAASLQPNAASIPSWRARSLAQLGQVEEAFSEASRAVELDPLAPGRHIALAELSLQLGRYDQAIESARTAFELEPRIMRSRSIEARALLLAGRPEECADLELGAHQVLRATCLREAGRAETADAIVAGVLDDIRRDRLRTNGYTPVVVYEDLAVDFAMRGDAANAMFWCAKAYAESPTGIEIRILESALFDKVRDDENFSSSIAKIRSDLYPRVRRESERFR